MVKKSDSPAPKEVKIEGEYITLGQLLKFVRLIDEGGMAKAYLMAHEVLVNGEVDNRRGRKIRPGDEVIAGQNHLLVKSK